jgi:hypothetical protein
MSDLLYLCRYLRHQIPEAGGEIMTSSDHRHATMNSFPRPSSRGDVINILGDQSDKEYSIFQESGDDDYAKTVAVGKMAIKSLGFILISLYVTHFYNYRIFSNTCTLFSQKIATKNWGAGLLANYEVGKDSVTGGGRGGGRGTRLCALV